VTGNLSVPPIIFANFDKPVSIILGSPKVRYKKGLFKCFDLFGSKGFISKLSIIVFKTGSASEKACSGVIFI
jgi:hypothetical protein